MCGWILDTDTTSSPTDHGLAVMSSATLAILEDTGADGSPTACKPTASFRFGHSSIHDPVPSRTAARMVALYACMLVCAYACMPVTASSNPQGQVQGTTWPTGSRRGSWRGGSVAAATFRRARAQTTCGKSRTSAGTSAPVAAAAPATGALPVTRTPILPCRCMGMARCMRKLQLLLGSHAACWWPRRHRCQSRGTRKAYGLRAHARLDPCGHRAGSRLQTPGAQGSGATPRTRARLGPVAVQRRAPPPSRVRDCGWCRRHARARDLACSGATCAALPSSPQCLCAQITTGRARGRLRAAWSTPGRCLVSPRGRPGPRVPERAQGATRFCASPTAT